MKRKTKPKKTRKKQIKKLTSERVPSGVSELDGFMEGGFELGSVNLIIGSAGSGKSIFATQFIVNGVNKYDENGLYICFEEKKDWFFRHMDKFGWNLKELENKKKFIFLEYNPEQVKKLLVEGGGSIESIVEKHNIKRLVIDSLSAFELLFRDEGSKKDAVLKLFELLRKWQITAIVTGELEESRIERQESGGLAFEADSVILLYFIKQKNIRKRALEILKMRGTKHAKKIFPLEITSSGIKIYPGETIF